MKRVSAIINESNQYIPIWIKMGEAINLSNLYPKEAREKL